jgi:hypothetical protein
VKVSEKIKDAERELIDAEREFQDDKASLKRRKTEYFRIERILFPCKPEFEIT